MEGLAWAAALSPDGRTLATLLRERTTTGFQKALMLSYPPGSPGRKIANFPGDYIVHGMAWSPDGRKIVFTLNANTAELLLIDTRRGTSRTVTRLPAPYPMSSAWLSDSRRILVALPIAGDTGNTALWLLDTETGKRIPALAGAEATSSPSLSVNGTVAYQTGSVDYDLIELPLDGSPVRPLLATRQAEGSVAWSPVAPEFVYVSQESEIRVRRQGETREGVSERTVVSAANFSTDPGGFAAPSFSPDGTRIAYTGGLGGWISAVSGGPPSSLGDVGGYARGLSWSPDGRWIALNVAGLQGRRLVEVRVGSTDKPITLFNETCDFAPSWSPDASRILCSTAQALYTIPAHGAAPGTPEFLGKEYEHLAAWSKDIRFIYAIRRANGKRQLGKLDWKSGAFQPIADIPLELVFNTGLPRSNRLSLSADGKSLATTLQKETGNIWLLDGFSPPSTIRQRMFFGSLIFGVDVTQIPGKVY
jgi:Tol biopolymer transport system component